MPIIKKQKATPTLHFRDSKKKRKYSKGVQMEKIKDCDLSRSKKEIFHVDSSLP